MRDRFPSTARSRSTTSSCSTASTSTTTCSASPQNLFIEDAIQETQVADLRHLARSTADSAAASSTRSPRAAATRSRGSGRVNLTNPSWSTETPFEVSHERRRRTQTHSVTSYEGTFGGPIVKDRLWFFTAGRWSTLDSAATFPETGLANTQTDKNKRGEIKLTGTLVNNHTIQGGYLNNRAPTNANRPTFSFSIDPFTRRSTARCPNSYLLHELPRRAVEQRSCSKRSTRSAGSASDGCRRHEHEHRRLAVLHAQLPACIYNAPYFDATDPESRNNRQLTGSLTYFWQRAGGHEIKGGYEFFRSQRTGGDSQSSTGYVFDADYLDRCRRQPGATTPPAT